MDKTFKALLVEEDNGTYTNKVVERSIDDLPDGDLLIKVSYSSLNYKDALSASGNPGVTRNFPHTPGIDAVGEVAQSNSSNFKEGDKVIVTGYDLGMNTSGGFSEFIRIPSSWAIQLPTKLSELDSMCLGTAGLTAGLSIYALDSFRGISDTKSIVTGSTGGVGSISVMLLSKLGSEVTALSGKTDKEDLLKGLGAKEVISREQLSELTRLPIGKPLWDLGIDVVSGEILSLLLASLTPGGAVACSGLVGGPSFESSIFPFIYGFLVLFLLWQAFRVMLRGFSAANSFESSDNRIKNDRTGQFTIHPELLDEQGKITDEELLTVRFSNDLDPPKQTESSSEDKM